MFSVCSGWSQKEKKIDVHKGSLRTPKFIVLKFNLWALQACGVLLNPGRLFTVSTVWWKQDIDITEAFFSLKDFCSSFRFNASALWKWQNLKFKYGWSKTKKNYHNLILIIIDVYWVFLLHARHCSLTWISSLSPYSILWGQYCFYPRVTFSA